MVNGTYCVGVLTELEKKRLSEVRLGHKLSDVTRSKISEKITAQIGIPVLWDPSSQINEFIWEERVRVKDLETNLEKSFNNLTEAASYLNVSRKTVKKCLDKNSLLKKRYEIKTG